MAPLAASPLDDLLAVPTGDIYASVCLGASMGVFGSIFAINVKKIKIMKDKECPYCCGSGNLKCAGCLGRATGCETCASLGCIKCENCKGRGRFIPTMLDQRISRDPETELEEFGLQ